MPNPLPLDELMTSWLIHLKSQRKSLATIRSYGTGVRLFLMFLNAQGLPAELTKPNVVAFMASQADHATATAQTRLLAVKLFGKWLAVEEGLDVTAVLSVKPPQLDQKAVAGLSDEELRRLVKACDGTDPRDKRDRAMVVLFAETGLRAAELLGLTVGDVDLSTCAAHVVRGKGGKERRVKFSASTAAVLDRHLRARRASGHPADRGALWMGHQGPLTYSGLVYTLGIRAQIAGLKGFHLHRLRHTMAVKWLQAGGSETGLMAQAGWTSRTMIDRYTRSANEALAAAEFDRLNMGIDLD